jgi:hypothetical protein
MYGTFKMGPAKVNNGPGFPHLPGAANDKGLSTFLILPCQKILCDETFHELHLQITIGSLKIQGYYSFMALKIQ